MKCKTLQKIVRGTLDLKTGYDFFRKLREACVCVAEVKITRRIYGDIGSDFVRISKKSLQKLVMPYCRCYVIALLILTPYSSFMAVDKFILSYHMMLFS